MWEVLLDDPAAQHNIVAWLITSFVCLAWLKLSEAIVSYGILDSTTSRKVVHIGTGLLFMLTWNLFPNTLASRYYAALVPLLISIRFWLIGSGFIKDMKTVQSMSRSGAPSELLYPGVIVAFCVLTTVRYGPLMYGIVFTISTVVYWADSPTGIVALVLLCVGDGVAFLMGVRYGRKKLPFNKNKSWVGSISFLCMSYIAAVCYVVYFTHLGWFSVYWPSYFMILAFITISATIVEALPIQEWDNITVFLVCVFVSYLFGY